MNLTRNHLTLIRMNRSRLIPNLTRNYLNLIPMSPSLLIPIQLIPNLSTRTPMNPIRNCLNLNQTSPIRTLLTRLRRSHCLLNKQTDKRQKELIAPKAIVNERTSSTPLLNRPAHTPTVRGGKLACVQLDLPARTLRLSARMRRSVRPLRAYATKWLHSLAHMSVRRLSWTVLFTRLQVHNKRSDLAISTEVNGS